jgi:hypothetical protein
MISQKKLAAALSVTAAVLPTMAFAKTVSCGSAKILSGTSCDNLVVDLDVSKCEKEQGPKSLQGKSECDQGRAKITVQSDEYRYRVRFAKTKDDWDGASWHQSGDVRQKELKSHSATKPEKPKTAKKEDKKSKRKIASTADAVPSKEVNAERGTPATGAAVAQPVIAQPPTSVPAPAAAPAPIAFSGFVDAYYGYNFNRPAPLAPRSTGPVENQNIPQGNTGYRYFDNFHNDIGLNLLELTIKKSGQEVNFVADLDFGNVADFNAGTPVNGNTQTVVDEVSKHIGQAVISYTPSNMPRLTIEVGKLITHVGYESYKARDDWQYSRSVLASYGLPFWHIGAHVGYAVVPDKFVTSVYIYNGWNSIYENNSGKTFGFQAKWTPNSDLTVLYNTIAGPENPDNTSSWRYLHEANATWAASQRLSFALETLYAWETKTFSDTQSTRWGGGTFHIKWNTTERSYLSPRFEIYRDVGGLTLFNPGVSQTVREVTLTHGYQLAQGLDTRLEGRWDIASGASPFQSNDGLKSSQVTATASVLYSF